ncbi:MAG: TIGR02302 family protein [Proteobacteria bacterium]|nr:TIGR02302 family protein [Pseudomonadota bacterium]
MLFARLNMLLETVWKEGLLFFGLIGVFIGLSLIDFWSLTGPMVHAGILAVFGVGLLFGAYKIVKGFKYPSRQRALRYLEKRNNLVFRPLQSLGASSEAEKKNNTSSSIMWRLYQTSLRKSVQGVRAGFPNMHMGIGDSYGLRAVVILVLAIGFVVAGPFTGERVVAGLTPKVWTPPTPVSLTAWITPPEYTGQAPVLLKMTSPEDLQADHKSYVVPSGSTFIARVFGGNEEPPVLQKSKTTVDFERLDAQNYEIETELTGSGLLEITKDEEIVGKWQFTVVEDEAPEIELLIPPEVTSRAAFRLQYRALDDYGVAGIGGEITRKGNEEKIKLALPTPGRGSNQIVGKSYHDLTSHPWAGLEVELRLFAEDQLGQVGMSDVTTMIMPERLFTHPVARALVEQRRNLVSDPEANKPSTLIALEAIALIPESLNDDFTAIMLLSTARSTLRYAEDQAAIDEVVELLWDTALRLENGDLSMAEAALRAAEQALMEALNSNASDSEIRKLVEELRAAMDNFLQALAQQQTEMAEQETIDPDSQNQMIESKDLQELLDKIDQFARGGARDTARELLSELQDIMENLQSAQAMRPTAEQQAMQEMLGELGDMMQRQQGLMDETLKNMEQGQGGQPQQNGERQQGQPQPGQPGQSGEGRSLEGLAQDQEALRKMLGEMMARLGMEGEIPDGLGRAERSMNEAREALEQGQGENAMRAQGEALENLRQSGEAMAQQMMESMQGQGTQSAGQRGQQGQNRDPLGRRDGRDQDNQGSNRGDGGLRSGGSDFSKARSFRDEVQRRLSDPNRSVLERDYLKRLLDFF